jgi:hypothetical protein
MASDTVKIRNILPSILGQEVAKSYIMDSSFIYSSFKELYESSLDFLIKGDTEKSIKYVVFGLDLDRNYKPLLNLCRTILMGLATIIKDSDFNDQKRKYKDFKKAKLTLSKTADEIREKIDELETTIQDAEEKIRDAKPSFLSFTRLYTVYVFKLNKFQTLIKNLKEELAECETELNEIIVTMAKIEKLDLIETYIRVLNIIVEVTIIPSKYEWALD